MLCYAVLCFSNVNASRPRLQTWFVALWRAAASQGDDSARSWWFDPCESCLFGSLTFSVVWHPGSEQDLIPCIYLIQKEYDRHRNWSPSKGGYFEHFWSCWNSARSAPVERRAREGSSSADGSDFSCCCEGIWIGYDDHSKTCSGLYSTHYNHYNKSLLFTISQVWLSTSAWAMGPTCSFADSRSRWMLRIWHCDTLTIIYN
jgi:hypothetical protein